ncbi:phosphatidylethanolamine N-methyltransferase [Cylindrobasidium torrendii FP15055 ss-10]|uniref:Phosphatidylethanolamine N-methyltransferase n=1 Tax=Cylindrobasidium torrendii FP15055 ss-10 TaxID=1314674 RepID=A0A0D7BH17_9AGAR|nr:phosphatidylethanolamine N-methyltransferase [Cylindrobasidium torrendii FP15055 ss-10]
MSSVRQRKPAPKAAASPAAAPKEAADVVWGKTPSGQVFRVPTTHDVLTALFNPAYPKSHLDFVNLSLLALQVTLFALLPTSVARVFFLCYFVFWRAAYDVGLAVLLTKQSKKRWMVKEITRRGWLDGERRPEMRQWIRNQLVGKMGKDYEFDELPVEYNTWLLFRQLVDIILVNDFLSYFMFAISCFRVPTDLSLPVHVCRWIAGVILILFNLWVKKEAHHVVKDYGWYWGDVFFQRGNLIFDGVFELAPHPMYSVGYIGYYGLSLIVGSYPVLFVSLATHASQFGFLLWFENPHIERTYGEKKAIAKRTPLASVVAEAAAEPPEDTPAPTDGDTATETSELETDVEDAVPQKRSQHKATLSTSSTGSLPTAIPKPKTISHHDLFARYFRRDMLIFKNFDFFRASDTLLLLSVLYSISLALFVPSPTFHFIHAISWCLFHTVGLGLVLSAQSESKFLVRHFMKHYHYPAHMEKGAILEAFTSWKVLYNGSQCMTYVSLIGLVYRTYTKPTEWLVGDALLRHTIGVLLVLLHVWATTESYDSLGAFGWFYGDFFMDDFPRSLEYKGIYRYINNPDMMGGAAWFGLACISANKLVVALGCVRHLAHWWFLRNVENPHMQKLYGDTLRKEAGFVKVIRNATSGLRSVTSTHMKVATEVKGTWDKVYEETADAVEEFLKKSRPKIKGVVQDTKFMLQQSREKLVITRVAPSKEYDATKYSARVVNGVLNEEGVRRFHLGQPITVAWEAPKGHSRRDWIGIYRVGANKSSLVTRTSSMGMWEGVYGDEWDGDLHVGDDEDEGYDSHGAALSKPGKRTKVKGKITFKGNTLPWLCGMYEVRYHHDGKYNVMSMDGPIEIYVDQPATLDYETVKEGLMKVVPLALDEDPALIPISCRVRDGSGMGMSTTIDEEDEHDLTGAMTPKLGSKAFGGVDGDAGRSDEVPTSVPSDDGRDPDDFTFWSEKQAKRIAVAMKQMYGVDYTAEVIVADANLGALARRVLVSKEVLGG